MLRDRVFGRLIQPITSAEARTLIFPPISAVPIRHVLLA